MRNRSRNSYSRITIPARYTHYPVGGDVKVSDPYDATVCTSTEIMIDSEHGDRVHTLACTHRKAMVPNFMPVKYQKFLFWQGPNNTLPVYQDQYVWTTAALYGGDPGLIVTNSHAEAAGDLIAGRLNGEVLTPVFFNELPQMKDTYQELTNRKFGVKKFANKFLAYEFGVRPFLKDLSDLRESWSKIQAHVDYVNNHQVSPAVMTARTGTTSGYYQHWRPIDGAGSKESVQIDWVGKQRSYVKGHFFRQYTTTDEIKASLDYYGGRILNNVWESIPYSFIVDWFFDCGGLISRLHPKFQEPCFKLVDSGSIHKAQLIVPTERWDDEANRVAVIGFSNVTYFSRIAGAPLTPTSLLGSGLSPMKTALGIALALQRA